MVDVDEDKLYHVGRIRFTGNHTTRDAVLRRETFLNEGDVLSTELLKHTVRRLNQLGYFKPVEAPRIVRRPAPRRPARRHVRPRGAEPQHVLADGRYGRRLRARR